MIKEFDLPISSSSLSFDYSMANGDLLTFKLEWMDRFSYFRCGVYRQNSPIALSRAANKDVNLVFGVEGYENEAVYFHQQPYYDSKNLVSVKVRYEEKPQ